MGGHGSGNREDKPPRKLTVEESWSLDVLHLYRKGFLRPGTLATLALAACYQGREVLKNVEMEVNNSVESVTLCHNTPGHREKKTYNVSLFWTSCHFGGARPWFVCPGCNRRAVKLFLPPVLLPGNPYFLCRRCHSLGYRSDQQNDDLSKARRRIEKLTRRVSATVKIKERPAGWWFIEMQGGKILAVQPRPKGMHWRTYQSIISRIYQEYMAKEKVMERLLPASIKKRIRRQRQ